MAKEKEIYTVTKTVFEEDNITFRHEKAFEKLYDALQSIGIWSNMKTAANYTVGIYNSGVGAEELCFIAEKKDGIKYFVVDKEEIVLRKISLKLEKDEET